MIKSATETHVHAACTHCGDDCPDQPVMLAEKPFCCQGCKAVYELLDANNLCTYYSIDEKPGNKIKEVDLPGRFDYLDTETVQAQLLSFRDEKMARLTLYIPQMHCSSCIWLLENLHKLNEGVSESRVNFLRKEISISYLTGQTSLKDIVKLLTAIGYEPEITLAELGQKKKKGINPIIYKIGLAGFCFGNVMLLAFPDYLSFTEALQSEFGAFFGYLSIALSLPVLFYSAQEFYINAWNGLKQKYINLDFPIALGLTALMLVSLYDIFSHTGPGYLDSFTGLVFFMLIGRWLQQRTYDSLRFDRDFTSYFPVAVTLLTKEGERSISVKELKKGHRILVRNQEVIPADAILMRGTGQIDYSFVTGESVPVAKVAGEVIYAGGRQTSESIELEVVREVSQGYLTQLWNNPAFQKEEKQTLETFANKVGRYFVAATLVIALGAVFYWVPKDMNMAVRAFTSVLVIACPCALSLATPFALGNALSVFGRNKFYLKNSAVAEVMGRADTIVFDKTGTLTEVSKSEVKFSGRQLGEYEKQLIAAAARQSTHPLSKRIYDELGSSPFETTHYREAPGKGVSAIIDGVHVKLGSTAFVQPITGKEFSHPTTTKETETSTELASKVFVSLDGEVAGAFILQNVYREGLEEVLKDLSEYYKLAVLSGDNDTERGRLRKIFGPDAELRFKQSPNDKLEYIQQLKKDGRTVLMVGDGLNDAGALQTSDAGIALTDTLTNFSPACDAILDATKFRKLSTFLTFTKDSIQIILATFILSFVYNGLGMGLAVQGKFTPIVSAILMPISTITVILFSTLMVRYAARRLKL